MYIWEIKIEFLWSFREEGDEEYDSFTVAAPTFDSACKKAKEINLKDHKPFKDEENPKITHSIKNVEIIKVERMIWIDG